jgi:ABC-type amino acid transport substrate-binding protein
MTVVTVFTLATIATASLAIGLQYYFGQATAKQSARQQYELAATSIAGELRNTGKTNTSIIQLLASNPTLHDPLQRDAHIEIFTHIMAENPLINGLYVGSGAGTYFEVTNLDATETARSQLTALPSDRWLSITVNKTDDGYVREIQYLDSALKVRLVRTEVTDFNAVIRPWYTSAMESNTIQRTDPYIFAHLGVPGSTISKRIGNTDAVVGMDLVLSSVSDFLNQHNLAGQGDIFLYNGKGQVLASTAHRGEQDAIPLAPPLKNTIASLPTLVVSNEKDWPPFDYSQSGVPQGYSIDVIRMIANMIGLKITFTNGHSWPELTEQFKGGQIDLLHSVLLTPDNRSWGLAGDRYVTLPYGIMTTEETPAIDSLDQLNGKTIAIGEGWSIIPVIRKQFPNIEIIETKGTLAALEAVLNGDALAAMDNEIILRYVAHHYFLRGLRLHSGIDFGTTDVPDRMHIMVHADQPQLRSIIDRAIGALTDTQTNYLQSTWLDLDKISEEQLSETVPTEMLI